MMSFGRIHQVLGGILSMATAAISSNAHAPVDSVTLDLPIVRGAKSKRRAFCPLRTTKSKKYSPASQVLRLGARALSVAVAAMCASDFVEAQGVDPFSLHDGGLSVKAAGGGRMAQTVPLSFPGEVEGLPIPIRVINNGTKLGAAGRGWDIPLSFIREDRSFAFKRPTGSTGQVPQPKLRVTLQLLGESMELVQESGDWWVAHAGSKTIRAEHVQASTSLWRVYDGTGITYTFNTSPVSDLTLLSRINGPTGRSLELEYRIAHSNVAPTGSTTSETFAATSVDLTHVRYNDAPGVGYKHDIALTYGEDESSPLSISILDQTAVVRSHTLARIDLASREQAAGSPQTVESYHFEYARDPDTQLPQLRRVFVSGRAGTPEYNSGMTLAEYEYGTATSPAVEPYTNDPIRALEFAPPKLISVPQAAASSFITKTDVIIGPSYSLETGTNQGLFDLTGDGRADFVFPSNNPSFPLTVARGRPDGDGHAVFNDTTLTGTLNDAVMKADVTTFVNSTKPFFDYPPGETPTTENATLSSVWEKFIDVNGDGRVDYLSAKDSSNYDEWVAYINTPDATYPHNIHWVKKVINVAHIRAALNARGNAISPNMRLPLSRSYESKRVHVLECVKYSESDGKWHIAGQADATCWQTPVDNLPGLGICTHEFGLPYCETGSTTSVAWDLKDVNSDGAVDLLMRATAPKTERTELEPCMSEGLGQDPSRVNCQIPRDGALSFTFWLYRIPLSSTEVMFNAANIDSPIPNSAPISIGGCGIHQYETLQKNHLTPPSISESCALEDFNGDGLLDSLLRKQSTDIVVEYDYSSANDTYVAMLGNGRGFLNAYVALPGPTSISTTSSVCPEYDGTDHGIGVGSEYRNGYIDVTGDGIPDFVGFLELADPGNEGSASYYEVLVGTGSGFVAKAMAPIFVSTSFYDCYDRSTSVLSGLFDLNGDGTKEVVEVVNGKLQFSDLVGRKGGGADPRALSAGRLTAIENGHGGRTEITYKSAKDDGSTSHQVPGPEIVVSSVKTTQASTGQTSETKYAYGNPIFGYDSFAQRFRSFGYGRSVSLTRVSDGPRAGLVEGTASISDAYPLEDQIAYADWKKLFDRYLRAGQPKDVTQLSGTMSDDPWSMLTLNLATASRRGSTHYDYDSKVWADSSVEPGCTDFLNPYGVSPTGLNTCKSRGFLFRSASSTWSGAAAPPSTDNVMTDSHVVNIDDFGRVTLAFQGNDTRRTDDDVCVATTYAAPPANTYPRVLTAVAESKVIEADSVKNQCATKVLASSSSQYDGLPQGQVKDGLLTSQTVDRRDASGQVLNTIRQFDAAYNAQGNLESVTTKADNGNRVRTVSFGNYDPFGLVPTSVTTTGTAVPSMTSTTELDPWTLVTLSTTDANGLKVGTVYDGFGRPTRSTITPVGGIEGVMATTEYVNFESTNPTVQRQVITKTFDNPVPPAQVGVALGHTSTTYLDDFGRAVKSKMDLGADYADDMIVSDVRFDAFGRVSFAADPYPTSQNGATAYGTTNYFNTDGTPKCSIRGKGPQALPGNLFGSTNEAEERYPTCFDLRYTDGKAIATVWGADALLTGSPQAGVSSVIESSAIGRQLNHSTWSPSSRLERSDFDYDRLGRVIGMTRYKTPGSTTTAPQDPVKWAFAYDSLGQVLRQDEPNENSGLVSRFSDYSDWSELVETRATATGGSALPDKRQSMTYDALGRLVTSKQSVNGQSLPEATYLYSYDTETLVHSSMPVNPMLGQLATVTSPTSTVHFAYDELGRMAAKATVAPDGKKYIETVGYDGDGTISEVANYLPDTNNAKEKVAYAYDSARRLTTASYFDAAGVTRPLLATSLIDAFGRVRVAKIGDDALYEANYADTGRRLLKSMTLQSHSGEQREVTIEGYDPAGREKARKERVNLVTEGTVHTYDALGRLVGSIRDNTQQILSQRAYSYDALGNLLSNADVIGSDSVALSYRADNRDRLCSIGYGAITPPTTCNVMHDALGNVLEQPAVGGARSFSYLPSGDINKITKADGSMATFRYDAFGDVQELDITGPGADNRHDRRYGSVESHDVIENGAPKSLLTRNFAVGGISASRKGPSDKWVFALGEARGNRFFVDEKGEFVQDVAYEPYGEARSTGAVWNSPQYTHEQWNGGDSLAKFGIHHLGARLYDPKIGRFLSADPLTQMRTATTSNPYAFASNDPINSSDPTGLSEWFGNEEITAYDAMRRAGFSDGIALDSLQNPGRGEFDRLLSKDTLFPPKPNLDRWLPEIPFEPLTRDWRHGPAFYEGYNNCKGDRECMLGGGESQAQASAALINDATINAHKAEMANLAAADERFANALASGGSGPKTNVGGGGNRFLNGRSTALAPDSKLRGRKAVWQSTAEDGRKEDCWPATLARAGSSILHKKKGPIMTTDSVMKAAGVTQAYVNANKGLREEEAREMADKVGLRIGKVWSTRMPTTPGHYAAVVGRRHVVYFRVTASGSVYLDDSQSSLRAKGFAVDFELPEGTEYAPIMAK